MSTTLELAATNRTDEMKKLLSKGIAVDLQDPNTLNTPLHIAAFHGRLGMVETLLEMGSRADIPNLNKRTALCSALTSNQEDAVIAEVVKVMLRFGVDANHAVNIQGDRGLHLAASNGLVRTCAVLLKGGADCGARNNDSNTALTAAVKHCLTHGRGRELSTYLVVVVMLLRMGADPNTACGYNEETALHLAVREQHEPLVAILLHFRASTKAMNANGETVAQMLQLEDVQSYDDDEEEEDEEQAASDRQEAEAALQDWLARLKRVDWLHSTAGERILAAAKQVLEETNVELPAEGNNEDKGEGGSSSSGGSSSGMSSSSNSSVNRQQQDRQNRERASATFQELQNAQGRLVELQHELREKQQEQRSLANDKKRIEELNAELVRQSNAVAEQQTQLWQHLKEEQQRQRENLQLLQETRAEREMLQQQVAVLQNRLASAEEQNRELRSELQSEREAREVNAAMLKSVHETVMSRGTGSSSSSSSNNAGDGGELEDFESLDEDVTMEELKRADFTKYSVGSLNTMLATLSSLSASVAAAMTTRKDVTRLQCSVCFENDVDTHLGGCTHLFCSNCVRMLRKKECPQCRAPFDHTTKVIFS